MSSLPDLSVEFAGLHLKNPILAASGTFGYGLEFAALFDLNKLGGFVTKGLSRRPMRGNPPPRLAETPAGMLNSVGLQNIGVDAFIRDKLPQLRRFDTAVIVNVFGEATEDYVEVVRQLEAAEGVSAYELNLSCPNTKCGGMIFGSYPALIREVTSAVKNICRRPLWVKLTPNVEDIAPPAQAAAAAGADAISLINTFIGRQMPSLDGLPSIPSGRGGLSGPAIHSLALKLIEQAVQAVSIPVIGIGGVITGAGAAEFLRAGAAAVEVGTANFYDPIATVRIVKELESYCRLAGFSAIGELRKRLV